MALKSYKKRDDSDMTAIDEIRKHKDMINVLVKAKKNLRLYPVHHPNYRKTVDDAYSRMSSILEDDTTIALRIRQYNIFLDDHLLYHNKDKDESLALFFFKDGLRELTFTKGITEKEVEEFLVIISMDFEQEAVDDDIVTLLWEQDFKHITYIVDDSFLLEDGTYEQQAIEQAKGIVSGHDEVMKAYDNALHMEDDPHVSIYPLTNDDIAYVIKEIQNDQFDKTHLVMNILFEIFSFAQGKEEFETVTKCVKQALNYALTHADIEVVNYALSKIKHALKTHQYPEQAHAYLSNIENYINSATFIKLFGKTIDDGAEINGKILQEFSSHINKVSMPHYISVLGELENISSRRIVISILTELGKEDISLVAKWLNDERWYVVRNIIYIFRQIGDRSSVKYLVDIIHHPEGRVRKEVIHALGEMGTEDELKIFKEFMSDETKSVRIAACMAIGRIGTELSKRMLLEHIESRDFRDRGYTEKKEILKVLSQWKDKDVTDFLMKNLEKRTLFHRSKNDETRAAAVYCLGLMGGERERHMIEKFKDSKNKIIRSEALKIKRKIDHVRN